ncbi:MFS transporter [Haladaptatus pallidirubidus]|uniref:MFS transporter n=1 Tax=Haladaptatus pallidirubidus TaxID=1008152 RepID=UPI001D120886|nr:MFS transporter [Haladaptatus pallidirubidus]
MSSSRRSVTSHLQTTVRGLRGDGRGWVLTAVALGWAFTLGLRFLVPALLPQIKSAFEVTNATAGLAITALWVGYALMQFPAGVLINRVGERTLLTTSLCLSGISLCLIGLSPVFVVFFAGSTAFGLGSGLYGPSRGTVLSRTYTRNAGAAFGVTLAVGSIGSAVLPNLATSMVDAVGWRPILACLSVPFFVVAVLAWRVIPERERGTTRGKSESIDGGTRESTDGGNSGSESTKLLDRRALRDIVRTLSDRSIFLAVVAMALLLFVFQGLTAFLPTYLQTKGMSQQTAALLFGVMFIAGAISQVAAGSAADRFGVKPVLLVVTTIGVVTPAVLTVTSGTVVLAIVVAILGSRMAIAPVTNAYVVGALPEHIEGSAWGFLRTGFFLVGSTGSTFVGYFADADRFDFAFLVLAGLSAVALGLYAMLPDNE